ncbi:MAG: HupE/UreJ family protein [Gammaproteobacteria bacterium]|nr:HupE/UreJ family protein [Gammaproteobacteria bacterium]
MTDGGARAGRRLTRALRRGSWGGIAIVASPAASAHTAGDGAGAFYAGLGHLFSDPAHVLLLLAIGLGLGLRPSPTARFGTWSFCLTLLVGLGAAFGFGLLPGLDRLLLALAAVTALSLVVVGAVLPGWAVLGMASLSGLAIGLDSAPPDGPWQASLMMLSGTLLGALMGVVYVVVIVGYFQKPWQRIGVRVAGSWIAASALLVLALRFAGV